MVQNQWVKLIVVHPESQELFHFTNESFELYSPLQKENLSIHDELELAATSQENLPIYILK